MFYIQYIIVSATGSTGKTLTPLNFKKFLSNIPI